MISKCSSMALLGETKTPLVPRDYKLSCMCFCVSQVLCGRRHHSAHHTEPDKDGFKAGRRRRTGHTQDSA